MARGLCNLVNVEGGPTDEQLRILSVLIVHFFGLKESDLDFTNTLSPSGIAAVMTDASERRRFMQLATMLELCRHPKSEHQLKKLEDAGVALDIAGVELNLVKELCHKSAPVYRRELRPCGKHNRVIREARRSIFGALFSVRCILVNVPLCSPCRP